MYNSLNDTKPLSKFTNREWRGTVIAFTFIGILVFFFGLYERNWSTTKIGLIFAAIGIGEGFILHLFFGIRIIQLRKDFKHYFLINIQ